MSIYESIVEAILITLEILILLKMPKLFKLVKKGLE
jgi:hypothetical protein